MKNRIRSKRGFTLIELMIVIAIIGMLAAIAIPQIAKYREMRQNVSEEVIIQEQETIDTPAIVDPMPSTTSNGNMDLDKL